MKIFIVIIFASISISAIAAEGVMIKSKTTDLNTGVVTFSDIYISDSKVILKNTGSSGSSILFDASREVFTYIDDNKKEYYQFDKATLVQLKEQVRMFAQMMQQFASQMPESQRKKLDQLINPGSAGAVDYKKVADNKKIKNWGTQQYEGYKEGEKIMTLNIASYQTLGIDASKFSILKSMLLFAKENLEEIATLLPAGSSLSQFSFDKNSPILKDGLPVKSTTLSNGKANNVNTVESVVLVSIPDSQFSIPTGYVRKSIDIKNQLGK